MKTTIVVPCFDEAENVPRLIAELSPVAAQLGDVELIFVDDGSMDDTAALLEAHMGWPVPARVVRHGRNRGLGAAVRTGIAHARGDRIVVTDADGTYDFRTIPTILGKLSDAIGVVTASPYHPQGRFEGVPAYRLILSRGASALYRVLVDRRVHTWTAMYRAYRADVARETPFDSDEFMAMTEILVNARRAGHGIAEMPAVLRVRQFGQSKARTVRIIRSHLQLMWRLLRMPGNRPVSRRRVVDEPRPAEATSTRC